MLNLSHTFPFVVRLSRRLWHCAFAGIGAGGISLALAQSSFASVDVTIVDSVLSNGSGGAMHNFGVGGLAASITASNVSVTLNGTVFEQNFGFQDSTCPLLLLLLLLLLFVDGVDGEFPVDGGLDVNIIGDNVTVALHNTSVLVNNAYSRASLVSTVVGAVRMRLQFVLCHRGRCGFNLCPPPCVCQRRCGQLHCQR